MKNIIYLKYGELTLKGKNRSNFIDCLYRNVINALKDFNKISIIKEFDAMTIQNIENNFDQIIEILKRVPGIYQIIPAYSFNFNSFDDISNGFLDLCKEIPFNTFKIETKRHDKTFPINSMEVSKKLGAVILKGLPNKKVLMTNYDKLFQIEIRKNLVICYYEKISGTGGFPVGINGKCLILISGGIDSPVAATELLKKGMHVDFLTFMTPPHTSIEAENKVKNLINVITLNNKIEKSKLYVCNFTNIQHELAHISDKSYQITLMRRYFFRIAQDIKNIYHYDAIATGESLGQVASQTIESMTTISSVLDPSTVVLRPLLTFDKLEIIKKAKELKTYDISIQPYADCCSLFVPANPVTKPKPEIATKLESELDFVDEIYHNVLKKYIEIK